MGASEVTLLLAEAFDLGTTTVSLVCLLCTASTSLGVRTILAFRGVSRVDGENGDCLGVVGSPEVVERELEVEALAAGSSIC